MSAEDLFIKKEKVVQILKTLMMTEHEEQEDPWYSCPLSKEGCANDRQDECTCSFENINEGINNLIKKVLEG